MSRQPEPANLEVVFADAPPPPTRASGRPGGGSQFDKAAAALLGKPGQWARIARWDNVKPDAHGSDASTIKHGKIACFAPAGSFEAVRRVVDNGVEVWARYVGAPTTATPTPTAAAPPPVKAVPKPQTTAPRTGLQGSAPVPCNNPRCHHAPRLHDLDGCRVGTCPCTGFETRLAG